MNIPKEYIEMSEKATVLQNLFKTFDLTDFPCFVYDKITERVSIMIWTPKVLADKLNHLGNTMVISIESDREKYQYVPEYEGDWHDSLIWIPMQHQLQKIMLKDESRVWRLHEWFDNWIPDGSKPQSFEELWIRFVMDEKYNQIWNGKEWITKK